MKKKTAAKEKFLNQWIWESLRNAVIIPSLLIVFLFIIAFFTVQHLNRQEILSRVRQYSESEISNMAKQQADTISQQLLSISGTVELYRHQTVKAIAAAAVIKPEDQERLVFSPDGIWHTTRDKPGGGAAIFYSGLPQDSVDQLKIAKAMALEGLMKDIIQAEPLASSVYLNTYDTLNIIYPYIDSFSLFAHEVPVTEYNFYYEADLKHNPDKEIIWTDVYLDPAGRGWIASAIAPVYNGNFLEGVVGIDVTVETIVNQILNLNVPWDGYGILVDKSGMILALPKKGQTDWGLTELTTHDYAKAIYENTFKPEDFNILKNKEISGFTRELVSKQSGLANIAFNEDNKLAAWSTIPQTGWKLILLAPDEIIYADIDRLQDTLFKIGTSLIIALLILFAIFVLLTMSKVNKISDKLSIPLNDINKITDRIGSGEYYNEFPDYEINEFNRTASHIGNMGALIGEAGEVLNKQIDSFLDVNLDMLCAIDWDGNFIKVNRRFEEILGYDAADIVGSSFMQYVHEDDYTKTEEAMRIVEQGERVFGFVNRYRCKDGKIVHIEWNAKPDSGRIYYASARDITQKILHEKELLDLAGKDKLTGLHNRYYFDTVIRDAMEHADRFNESLSILLFDLDYFKETNDHFGHQTGDVILKAIARVAENTMRNADILFRFGGDEFLLLMPQTSLDGAYIAAEKMRAAIETVNSPITGNQTVSIGVSEKLKSESLRHWFRRTDEALYRAKQKGRNIVVASDGNEKLPLTSLHTDWRQEWESGHAVIDRQHQELLKTGNQLIDTALKDMDPTDILKVLEQLLSQTADHFNTEEEILESSGYPEFRQHSEIHRQLYEKAQWLKNLYKKGEIRASAYFSYVMDDLILQHLMDDDIKFFPFINH